MHEKILLSEVLLMQMQRTRHQLTIAESLELLRQGHAITCADGFRWFPYSTAGQFGLTYVGRAAMDHLRKHGHVEFAGSAGGAATWKPSAKLTSEVK